MSKKKKKKKRPMLLAVPSTRGRIASQAVSGHKKESENIFRPFTMERQACIQASDTKAETAYKTKHRRQAEKPRQMSYFRQP